jgi:hypothetical protein
MHVRRELTREVVEKDPIVPASARGRAKANASSVPGRLAANRYRLVER